MTLAADRSIEATMTMDNDGGWCGIATNRAGPGLVTAKPSNGRLHVRKVGANTRVDYIPDRGFVGTDTFAVKLLPDQAELKVAATVQGSATRRRRRRRASAGAGSDPASALRRRPGPQGRAGQALQRSGARRPETVCREGRSRAERSGSRDCSLMPGRHGYRAAHEAGDSAARAEAGVPFRRRVRARRRLRSGAPSVHHTGPRSPSAASRRPRPHGRRGARRRRRRGWRPRPPRRAAISSRVSSARRSGGRAGSAMRHNRPRTAK